MCRLPVEIGQPPLLGSLPGVFLASHAEEDALNRIGPRIPPSQDQAQFQEILSAYLQN